MAGEGVAEVSSLAIAVGNPKVKVNSVDKIIGEVPLTEADIVVSGGRAQTDASEIDVQVQNGEVTLTGKIHSWNERALVKHAAWSNTDVVKVIDKLDLTFS